MKAGNRQGFFDFFSAKAGAGRLFRGIGGRLETKLWLADNEEPRGKPVKRGLPEVWAPLLQLTGLSDNPVTRYRLKFKGKK
jgi:hypothetical protein